MVSVHRLIQLIIENYKFIIKSKSGYITKSTKINIIIIIVYALEKINLEELTLFCQILQK